VNAYMVVGCAVRTVGLQVDSLDRCARRTLRYYPCFHCYIYGLL